MQEKGLSGDDHMVSPEMAEMSKWEMGEREVERKGGSQREIL